MRLQEFHVLLTDLAYRGLKVWAEQLLEVVHRKYKEFPLKIWIFHSGGHLLTMNCWLRSKKVKFCHISSANTGSSFWGMSKFNSFNAIYWFNDEFFVIYFEETYFLHRKTSLTKSSSIAKFDFSIFVNSLVWFLTLTHFC